VGVEFGTVVHRVLEATDFAAPDLVAELERAQEAVLAPRHRDLIEQPALVEGLREAIETPFGPLLDDVRLRDLALGDRLNELEFELPLVGGDEPTGTLTVAAIAAVLREYLGGDDPLAGYAERLADPALRSTVRGYLTGSIDLVLRVPGAGAARFAIVDYKTNWLGPPDEDLLLWHYRPAALRPEMLGAHYGLQAVLYTTALHRYLRWRVPRYDPASDLSGVFYLFVRGMAGADTPVVDGERCGVFSWRPPAALVEALSDVLDQGDRP
jgi:exodeoxyribonuclease V beta subunit